MKATLSIWAIAILLMLFVSWLVFAAVGCTTTKQIKKQTTTTDSSYIKELEEQNRVLTTEFDRLTAENNELKYASVEFDSTRCPPTQLIIDEKCNADSIKQLLQAQFENQVKIYANGTIEAKGKLKRASYTFQQFQKIIAQHLKTIDSLKAVKQKETIKVVTKTEYKDKYVKRSFLNQWWLWLLFYIAGILTYHKLKKRKT